MGNIPDEILLRIFKLISREDLRNVVLVCSAWREIGETPSLWSSLSLCVNTGNMRVIPEILSSGRMEGLSKLWIKTALSE